VHRVDRPQRSDHDLEAVDPIFGIPTDDVDAVDRQTSEPGLELEHSRLLTEPAPDIAELGVVQDLQRRDQVRPRDCTANLRRVRDRRFEYHVVGQQLVEQVQVTAFDYLLPALDCRRESLRLLIAVLPAEPQSASHRSG
jgi:hypothetical protein